MCFWRRKKKAKEEALKETKPVEKVEIKEEPAKVEKVEKAEVKEEVKEVKNTYHISQNKDAKSPHHKKWRVRKQGSQKTIQYFDTQAEAIKFAKDLAENNDGNIVIHKTDGSIRKQDYSK